MENWQWLLAALLMLYTGFVFGVQYAWNRERIHPYIWGLTHGTRRLNDAVREGSEKPPWVRP